MFVKTIIALSLAILAVAVPQPQADKLIGNLEVDGDVLGSRIGDVFAPPPPADA
ncbi:hypothetical protein BJV78DRAFT_1285701 [Lactifluus subvellereus]|nr:hypothetical protein BJV78DRAFT_1285701 [Lactifluus subvellereus]